MHDVKGKSDDVVSVVPKDTSNHGGKSLGTGGGGMHDNPGIKGISTTPFKRPNVSRSSVLKDTVHVPVKSGLTVKNAQPKSAIKRETGHPPGGKRTIGKEPVK